MDYLTLYTITSYKVIKVSISLLCLLVTACGGSGGNSGASENSFPKSSASSVQTQSSENSQASTSQDTTNSSSEPPSSISVSSSSFSSVSSLLSSMHSYSSITSSSQSLSSFDGSITINQPEIYYINEPAILSASASTDAEWRYDWQLIENERYQRQNAFGFIWDSTAASVWCHPQTFGKRLSGKLHPPRTGLYRFLVAADTQHEFYLEKNDVNERLTYSKNRVDKSEFFTFPEQQSEWIELQAGKSYPIEFFYIKANSQGHYSVLWQQPGSTTWEEIPDTAYSKPDELTASGTLDQEILKGSWSTISKVREQLENIHKPDGTNTYTGSSISFFPSSHSRHTIEVTATTNGLIAKKQISFVPRDRFYSEDDSSSANFWMRNFSGKSQLTITSVDDNSAQGNVLQIEKSSSEDSAEWYATISLVPYKAYEVRARVRLLNAPSNLPITSGMGDKKSWALPRLRIGVHGDASEQGIDPRNPSQWRDVAVDFIVPFHGKVDIHAHMGEYTGKFQIDNLHLVDLNNSKVTNFDFPNLSANIYNDLVDRAGGYEATYKYFSRIAQAAADMRELSGKYTYAQCQKENIFIPRNWSVFSLGTNYNYMILKTPDLLTDSFLKDVWASDNIVGGVMIHEIEHSFDFPGSSFDAHLPVLLQAYAMDKRNLLRTEDSRFVTVDQWMESERNRFQGCISEPAALVPKLFEFQKLLPADQKWDPFKQVMHDRWSPYKIETEDRSWPIHSGSEYEQYRAWWRELKSYTGLDGWELVHSPLERQQIESMYQRRQSNFSYKDPATQPVEMSVLYLWEASRKSANAGWGEVTINTVKVGQTCNDKSIYAHAPSKITYRLDRKWKAFDTSVFIRDNSTSGLAAARIIGDGVNLYTSSAFTARSGPVKLPTINVSGINEITLEFLDMGDNNGDWSVWLEPRLSR